MDSPLTLVGSHLTPEDFQTYLETRHPCFGMYAKSAPECAECRAPVVFGGGDDGGELLLLWEVCRVRARGNLPTDGVRIRSLTAREVRHLLEQGRSPAEIFDLIVGDADPTVVATEARNLLARRFTYLHKHYGITTPPVPPQRELETRACVT